jgi:hypothetical protein
MQEEMGREVGREDDDRRGRGGEGNEEGKGY